MVYHRICKTFLHQKAYYHNMDTLSDGTTYPDAIPCPSPLIANILQLDNPDDYPPYLLFCTYDTPNESLHFVK